ncbi:MAG TPA: MBL fold metallo-hydrolase, partial [Candidatus Cloacimonadota bacterium]|nr:MBL fold metallo-hydrolase [Candidatus Cloacimonadota bacterium]
KVKGTTPFGKTIAAFIAPLLVGRFRYDPVEPDVLVEDELLLSEYGNELRLIHTPGHTSGSISLIIDDEIALVGDSMIGLLPDRILPPYGDDEKQIRHSWRVLLDTGCSLFLPSHGSAVPKEVLLKNYINCFQ